MLKIIQPWVCKSKLENAATNFGNPFGQVYLILFPQTDVET